MVKRPDPLEGVALFEGFSKRDLAAVRDLLKEAWFNAGDEIVAQGQAGGRFYLITEGRASVIVGGRVKAKIGPGDYFGEMSLIDNSPRAATVRAETQVKTLSLSRLAFLSLLEGNWSLAKKVLVDLCGRVREADKAHVS